MTTRFIPSCHPWVTILQRSQIHKLIGTSLDRSAQAVYASLLEVLDALMESFTTQRSPGDWPELIGAGPAEAGPDKQTSAYL